jgi:hypothetical protein
MPKQTEIKLRRDTAANWTSINPTLAEGEQGLETDTGRIKIGNGATAWVSLPYVRANTHPDYETTQMSASTKTLTALSPRNQFFTGSTAGQIVRLPDATTLTLGDKFTFFATTGSVNVSIATSAGTVILVLTANGVASYTCISTAVNTAASWRQTFEGSASGATGSGNAVLGTSPTIGTATLITPSLTLSDVTSVNAGRLAFTGSTLRLGNGTTALTFSDNSANATTYAAASHTHPQSAITNLVSDLAAKANLSGATFTGVVKGMIPEEIGNAVNLDTYVSTGIYHQQANVQAASGTNYPVGEAGMLTVTTGAGTGFIYQTYQAFGAGNNRIYWRGRYAGGWSAWRQLRDITISTGDPSGGVNGDVWLKYTP